MSSLSDSLNIQRDDDHLEVEKVVVKVKANWCRRVVTSNAPLLPLTKPESGAHCPKLA